MAKRISKYLTILLIISKLSIQNSYSQRDIHLSQYNYQPLLINPALSGCGTGIEASLAYRKQWNNLQNSPQYSTFSLHFPIIHASAGFGLQLTNQSFGQSHQNAVLASFAYKIRVSKGTLALGLETGFRQFTLNVNDLIIENQNDIVLQNVDNIISPDLGLGIYFQNKNTHIGLTSKKILSQQYSKSFKFFESMYYTCYAMKKIKVGIDNQFILASFINIDTKVPTIANLTVNYHYNKGLRLGLGYKTSNDLAFIVGFQLNKIIHKINDDISIGYAYDKSLSKLNDVSNGSNEIMLTFKFASKPNPNMILKQKKAIHPVFF